LGGKIAQIGPYQVSPARDTCHSGMTVDRIGRLGETWRE
jgi:hypothetical protein